MARSKRFPAGSVASATLGLVMASGCAPKSNDPLENVRRDVASRGIGEVRWNRGTAEDVAATEAVAKLLAQELTVEAAIQVALLNNRHLQATYEEVGIAQADLVGAGLLKNPVFHAEIGFPEGGGTSGDDADDPFGVGIAPVVDFVGRVCHPTASTDAGSFDGPTLDLAVAFDFLDVLYIPLRKKIASENVKAAEAMVAGRVLDLAGSVRREFYALQALRHRVELQQTSVDAADAAQDLARRLGDAGNLNDLRVMQERADYEQARLDLAMAEEAVHESRERLNRLMGLWGEQTAWKTLGRLPELPGDEPKWEDVEKKSVERSLDLEETRRRMFALAQRAGVSRIEGIVPSADVGFSGTRADDGEPWTLGPTFSVPIPLFDWGQASKARAMAELRRARGEYYATAVDLRSHARMALARVRSARQRVEFYQKVVLPLREQVVVETQKRYNAMFDSQFSLLHARRQQLQAEEQFVQSLLSYWTSRAELEQLLNGRMMSEGGGAATYHEASAPMLRSREVHAGH